MRVPERIAGRLDPQQQAAFSVDIDSVDKGDGTIVARSYDYAAGYRGHGKVTRNIFRFEFVKRATGG